MAKLTLSFDTIEEKDEMEMAVHAIEAWTALSEIREIVRRHNKYNSYKTIQEMADAIQEVLSDHRVIGSFV